MGGWHRGPIAGGGGGLTDTGTGISRLFVAASGWTSPHPHVWEWPMWSAYANMVGVVCCGGEGQCGTPSSGKDGQHTPPRRIRWRHSANTGGDECNTHRKNAYMNQHTHTDTHRHTQTDENA